MTTLNALKGRREQILALAAAHGAGNVRVFGSVIRDEDTEESDVDLLVDMAEDRSLYDLVALKHDIEALLGRKADVLTPDSLSRYIKERILAEAIPL